MMYFRQFPLAGNTYKRKEMKKSLIWLLTIVMAITFGALLYFQIMYLENMVKMRDAQFSESVMRSLSATSSFLERRETLHFLEADINVIESSLYDDYGKDGTTENLKYWLTELLTTAEAPAFTLEPGCWGWLRVT